MIAGKQKKRLNDLLLKSAGLDEHDPAQIDTVIFLVKEYTLVLRKLYEKEPNVFVKFYKQDLKEIKKQLQEVAEEPAEAAKREKLILTRDLLERSIDSAITYLMDYARI